MKKGVMAILAAGAIAIASQAAALTAPSAVYVNNKGQAVASDRDDPLDAIDSANGEFYSLGLGGAAIFDFGNLVTDLGAIYEVTFNCSLEQDGTCSYEETASIYGLSDPIYAADDFNISDAVGASTFIEDVPNGRAQNGLAFTIPSSFRYLLVLDTSPVAANRDGFDIDFIEASVVPLPPAVLLLGSAFAGLSLLRRRKAA